MRSRSYALPAGADSRWYAISRHCYSLIAALPPTSCPFDPPVMVFPFLPPATHGQFNHKRRNVGTTPLLYVASTKKLVDSRAADDATKRERQASREKQLASLLAGGIAGTFSATVTCPIEVVKTRKF